MRLGTHSEFSRAAARSGNMFGRGAGGWLIVFAILVVLMEAFFNYFERQRERVKDLTS